MTENVAALDTRQEIVASVWRDQAIWSEVANNLKTEIGTWRTVAAIGGVLGAVLATLATTLTGLGEGWLSLRVACAVLGAIALAVVPFVARTKTTRARIAGWARARSASEALKGQIYRYLAGAPPYGPGRSSADLSARVHDIKDKVRDLNGYAAGIDPPQQQRPLELDINGYIRRRVDDQIESFYRPKARENANLARRFHTLEFWLGLLAVVLGAAAGVSTVPGWAGLTGLGAWVAVITTIGAAVTAHLAASRYDHQAITYFATADRLTDLRQAWRADAQRSAPERVARFVDDCERAISIENEAWLVEWTRAEREAQQG